MATNPETCGNKDSTIMLLCILHAGTILLTLSFGSAVVGRFTVTRSEIQDVLDFINMDPAESSTYTNVKYLGCFNDKRERALRDFYFVADRNKGNVVKQCAEEAKAAGYNVFGVQYYQECWADKEEECCRYNLYGKADPSKCPGDIGTGWTNAVYRIEAICHANGVNYTEGRTMTIPAKYDNIGDATCQHCTCASGKPSECRSIHCDLHKGGRWCEQYGHVPPGECCPKCECVHNGQLMRESAFWVSKKQDGFCAECRCEGGKAICKLKKVLCPVCDNPIAAEGQCCDICPKPTTQGPITIILPETTARPFFTLPPRPPGFRRNVAYYDLKNNQEDENDVPKGV